MPSRFTSAFQRLGRWRSDLELIHCLQPDGLFLAEYNGLPAGMVTAVIYPAFAYVGFMAVHENNQHQGLGLALMESLLAWLEKKKVPAVRLDASPAGQHLYEQLGFLPKQRVNVFQPEKFSPVDLILSDIRIILTPDLECISVLDAQAFGTNRAGVLSNLLTTYPERGFLLADKAGGINGYIIAQNSRIGPWVAREVETAEALLQSALSLQFPGPVNITVPEENPEAPALLKEYGFVLKRTNLHMVRGSCPATGQRDLVFGQASLSLG